MSKELTEKKNDLITRAEEVLEKAKTEQRELTEDEAAELAEIRDNVRRIVQTLELMDEFKNVDGDKPEEVEEEMNNEESRTEIEKREWNMFADYIRGAATGHIREDVNMTYTDNGAVIPTTVVNYIIKRVYDICPILERSQKFNVKGNLTVPFYPAEADNITVAYQDEFTAMESTSGSFGSVTLTGFLAGALTKVSRSLINNSNIDIVGFVVDEMAYGIKRFIEHELLIGTPGDATANPPVPAKVLGLSTLENKVTAEATNVITADEVIKVHDKIKDEFQANAIWIMSPETRTALRLLKDEMGRYMLQDDVSLPFGTSLLGKPVYVSDNMPEIAAGASVIYYGDMRGLATKFSEEINIQVLRERYADEHAYGVIGWFEFDAKVIDEQQIAKLEMAAS